jgi:hypothetical protein
MHSAGKDNAGEMVLVNDTAALEAVCFELDGEDETVDFVSLRLQHRTTLEAGRAAPYGVNANAVATLLLANLADNSQPIRNRG